MGEITELKNGRTIVFPSDMPSKEMSDVSSVRSYADQGPAFDAEEELQRLMKLKIPKKYKVKFNFTPEK